MFWWSPKLGTGPCQAKQSEHAYVLAQWRETSHKSTVYQSAVSQYKRIMPNDQRDSDRRVKVRNVPRLVSDEELR